MNLVKLVFEEHICRINQQRNVNDAVRYKKNLVRN